MNGVPLELASLRAGAWNWLADHSALHKEWIASMGTLPPSDICDLEQLRPLCLPAIP